MRKRILFRTLTILLAAATLLSSTSAYNLLVYANQEIDSSALSATETEGNTEPNITVQGGELQLDTNAEGDAEVESFSWGTYTNAAGETVPADGSSQYPYQISSLEHFLQVNEMVNDSEGKNVANANHKYFTLTADIDISSLTVADFVNSIGNAYFISADHKNPDSQQVYINIDGSYIDANGETKRHKITGGNSGWNIEIAGHQNFSIFGYLGSNSVVENIIFENINVRVSSANPRQVAIISSKNDGLIRNCSIDNCTIKSALNSNHPNSYYIVDGVYFYNGVAAAVADNAGTIQGVSVNNINITLTGEDDYIGAVVAQNRGLVDSSSVSGIQISATINNYYIGGIAGYNEPDSTSLGIKNCSVDMAGSKGTTKNFTRGAYVGGLVGSNDGYLYNSSVTGTFTSAQTPTAAAYNMLANVTSSSPEYTYYGGAAGISSGVISNITVTDVGFYLNSTTSMRRAYFGGITSTVSSADSVVNCVSTGSFVSASSANAYAGGIIGYAPNSYSDSVDIADGAIKNCYTLFKISNPTKKYVGAVIGWGGKASTLSNCYWSDYVSGCATSYVQLDIANNNTDLVIGADSVTGNLYSENKAVIAVRNTNVTVEAADLEHDWGTASRVIISKPTSNVTVPTNGLNNTLAKAPYTVEFTFPDGVGSTDKKIVPVTINLDVFVTTATGDPDSINDPMIISSSAQAKYIYLAPYGHYKLSQDVSVSTSAWTTPVFYGSVNGDGHTITSDGSVFAAVIGSRAGDIGSVLDTGSYSTDPSKDNVEYLKNGHIRNLTVDLSENITSSVFGNLINATFTDVALTDGDLAEDDGDSNTFDGFYATLTTKREATFASAANGYTYIYGCSTNVSAYVKADGQGNCYDDVAIFIAKLSGAVTVDNCYINANMYIVDGISSNTGRAAFIGNIADNTGYILNSAICTQIIYITTEVSGSHCTVVFGKMDNSANMNNYGKYKNIVWSKNTPSAVLYPTTYSFDSSQIVLWGGIAAAGGNYSYPEKAVAQGVSAGFNVSIPQNIKAFSNPDASDFLITADGGESSSFEITKVTVENNQINFTVKAKADAQLNSKDYIRIYHEPSGLTTFVRLVVKESGLTYNAEDGYYHITTASDIKFIADHFAEADPNVSGRTYGQAAYILDSDIYMDGIVIAPIGNVGAPFTGIFTGPVDENGDPLYTIYNLTVETTAANAGLFGAVDFSGSDMTLGTNATVASRGISNIAVSGATVSGKQNAAVLVGYAADPDNSLKLSERDDLYGEADITNVVISDSTVISGVSSDESSGRGAAAVIACVENATLNVSGVRIENVEVKSHYYPSTPYYFVSMRENSSAYSAGIGGVVGLVHETAAGRNMSSAMSVNISDVYIDGLVLSGTSVTESNTYVPANVGGVIGTFFTQYASDTAVYANLNIGNSAFSGEGYDVTVKDTVIMTMGNGGGIIGATNVKTAVNSAYVYGSKNPVSASDPAALPMRVWGNTSFFVGGIAGYVGSKILDYEADYPHDNASLLNVYGSIKNSKVENADVRAIVDTEAQLSRNATVGGVVGAINGNKDAQAVSSTVVNRSHIEGVIVGGIVGSSIDTNGSEGDLLAANSINIDSCSVLGSEIKTVEGCKPAAEADNGWMSFGVGGILGTNRRTLYSYAMHTSIQRCVVDENTTITNTIPSSYTVDSTTYTSHAATGGILGLGFENGTDAGAIDIKYNQVYASIVSTENIPADSALPNAAAAYKATLSATGGFVGGLIGNQYGSYSPDDFEVCDLSKIKIQHSVFGGSILGTDGIGGAIGVISAASAYTSDLPVNLLSDIAITGTLASSILDIDSTVYRGGIAIGHIAVKTNGVASKDDSFYAFDVAAGTDVTSAFNKIYFSSFTLDTSLFPVFGYHNATSAATSADYSPLADSAKTMLIECYEDVNTKDDNATLQFTDAESAEIYTLPDTSYPAATRPAGVDGAYSVAGQKWYGSNADIVKIKSTGPNDLTIEPLNSGTLSVAINYVGTVGDSTWSIDVSLPAGFRFKSNNQAPLDYVEVGGKTYYLITNPYDLAILGKNMTDADNMGNFDAAHMALNYWIARDIDLPESMFVTDGFYDGGFTPIGSSDMPFTGTLESMPEGTYTSAGGTEFVSDGNMSISGLQLATGSYVGLFAYAQGATFKNFTLSNVTGVGTFSTSTKGYMGAVAAVVNDYVVADGITLSGLNLTGANYTGGMFGGILPGSGTTDSSITNCSVVGDIYDGDDVYSNIISGCYGAAGILVHTNQYNTNMSNITVSDAQITQEYSGADNGYFDYGAAGISLAFSGTIKANGALRNTVEHCSITGEIASGVVTRTYTSSSKTTYTEYAGRTTSTTTPTARAAAVNISGTDLVATRVTGTHATAPSSFTVYYYSASGGILARVDAGYVDHNITDCTLDSDTYIGAPFGAGGIVGCYETPSSNSAVEYRLKITDCDTYATVEITNPNNKTGVKVTTSNYNAVGAGAILGYIGRHLSPYYTSISNCTASGIVRGEGNIGGIIGANWSTNTTSTLYIKNMDHHLVENCVVSAKLEVSEGVSAFATDIKGVGIILGHAIMTGSETNSKKYFDGVTNVNYPFYNIYFSDDAYRDDYARFYGLAAATANYPLNKLNGYTEYVYNLNRTSNYEINSSTYVLSYSDDSYRLAIKDPAVESERYVYKLNYSFIKGGAYNFNTSIFALDTTPISDADTFKFASDSSVNRFVVTANTDNGAVVSSGSESTEFVLKSITSSDPRVTITTVDASAGEFSISTQPLTSGVSSELCFNYSNGLVLNLNLEIEIKPEDYWFKENGSVNDILVFNAANLSYVRTMAGATSVITQCYDVYWTVSDSSVISAANAAVAGKKLSDVYSAEFIDTLGDYQHPNPTWDGIESAERYLTFDEMFNTTAETRGEVLLSELVGDISLTAFSKYGEDCGASIYNRAEAFTGTYSVLTAKSASGLTSANETYKIYGLELRSDIVSQPDVKYAGMFNKIGSGAVISDVSFVNPVINVVNSSAADNYVGVLAGEINGAIVKNVSVTNSGNVDSFIRSVRITTAANTYVGAISGIIGEGASVSEITVNGVDVVGASTAGNRAFDAASIKNVYAGSVAGSVDGSLTDININNVNVFVNRSESHARGYVSYAGAVAGKASGTISDAEISALVSGCSVTVTTDEITNQATVTSCEPAPSSETGDRIGGVVGLASGSLNITNANLSNICINAFDIAGGIVAEVANDENIAVVITGCDIGSDSAKAQVTISGTSNINGTSYGRVLYNAVGGVVGLIENAASVKITDCDFNGRIGQYEVEHKNCTAGGIIGLVGQSLASLNNIVITTSTVQGEVAGYRRNASSGNNDSYYRILGAAGGIIGKIYNFAYKTFNSSDVMISKSIMSAKIYLYNTVDGGSVKADYSTLADQSDTNVGKIIGEVRNDGTNDNFAKTAGTAADSNVEFTDYVSQVYVSSYPQDIVAYGCNTFYTNQNNDPADTYIDINKEDRYMSADAEGTENVSSFMVDSTIADPSVDPSVNPGGDNPYNSGTYSDVAIITFDEEQSQQGTTSSRYFRLAYDNIKLDESIDKAITFNTNNPFKIFVEDTSLNLSGVTVSANFYDSSAPGLTETVEGTSYSYSYYPGVITVKSNENVDIVGYISASYSYGLEVGIQFVSMEIAGNGSQADPFQVEKPKHFKVVRALRGAYYDQVANIDFADPENNQYSSATEGAMYASGSGIEPIGTSSAPFTGTYNGQGYILSNVYIARSDEKDVGFFGYIGTGNNAATLKNIHIELAGEIEITDENSTVTTVIGGISGGENVGGLVGYANNAVITNCSVADGFVVGKTRVGGLVGRTGTVQLDSCFTSTSTYSHIQTDASANVKNVGALVGYVGGTTGISKSFTLGIASVGTTTVSGAVGGLVGYVSAGTLTVADSLVGATVSDYAGVSDSNNNTYKGMTVGGAAAISNVVASGITLAAPRTLALTDTDFVNPVLGSVSGANVSNISVDTDLIGTLNGAETYSSVEKTQSGLYNFSVSDSEEIAGDAYTSAFVALAVIPVEVNEKEISDRSTYKNPGFYYPVTLNHGGEYVFVSSVIDLTDTVDYPKGLDEDMYGIRTEIGVNKNTDLLFRDADGKTTVHSNVYSDQTGAVLNDGTVHPNGEIAYDSTLPYFTVSKTVSVKLGMSVDIDRKVVYPVQSRYADGGTSYPVSTARQLSAISDSKECVEGSKFYEFYTLNKDVPTSASRRYTVVSDIDLGGKDFTPIVGYTGVFNGNGFTVDNLVINMPGMNEVGMFRTLEDATVKNLTVGVKDIKANDNVGALVGAIIVEDVDSTIIHSMVKIDNCHAVQSEGGSGIVATGSNVGGLIGSATRCVASDDDSYGIYRSSSSLSVSGCDVVGGLIGYCEQPVRDCYATGAVSAELTSSSASTQIHPWINNGGNATAAEPMDSSSEHGVGGLIGVLNNYTDGEQIASALVSYCFGSGIVTVTEAAYESDGVYGVGGLVGVNCKGTDISTSFSSGNVYYCYGSSSLASCSGVTVGVGGLTGVMYSELHDVYSSASIAADFGDVTSATAVGAGGVVGVAFEKLSYAYSSGATLGTTSTPVYTSCNYGSGGVIGILDCSETCANLIFDLNLSITDQVVGKILSGSIEENNSGAKTTAYMTAGDEDAGGEEFMSLEFGYVKGAYPYLKEFFRNDVSLTIRINALLSVVALQLNELDISAANGDGISMALNIPTEFTYIASGTDDSDNAGKYAYGYSDENSLVDAAQGIIDIKTNTLSIQRTQNEAQYVNFVISITSKDGNTADADGNVYSQVANRLVSRLCAPMLGTKTNPYLVATQADLSHVGMTSAELDSIDTSDPKYNMYRQWATPILENGTPTSGVVNFRLMGYVPLDGYTRTIEDLTTQTYNVEGQNIAYEGISFDGNGYSIRNLSTRLFNNLDRNSSLSNMTFENVAFTSNSLIGEVDGIVEGVNVYGTASGSNSAAIASTVNNDGKIIGSVVNVDYVDSASTSNVAGVAVTNNGTIELCASVGNFIGDAVSGMGALAVTNNGTIRDSFTIGNLTFEDATNLGGFVNSNTGKIINCYTRCNISVNNTEASRVIGGFAAQNSGSIKYAYSSGMFDLATDTAPLNIFVAKSTGTLEDCMFDKQMSGSTFSNIYDMAERTLDIVTLTNHPSMKSSETLTAYTVTEPTIDAATETYHNVYYPQLTSILGTYATETQIDDKGNEYQAETVRSRMYRVLRAYSFVSSATALVGNDNYIDNLALGSSTPLSYDAINNDLWRKTSGSDAASVTFYGQAGAGVRGRKILAGDTAGTESTVISALYQVTDFYGIALEDDAQLDIFAKVTGEPHPNFAGGLGTSESPFEISTPDHVVALSFYGTGSENYFKVVNDIDMSSAKWTSYIDNFKANLDGNGKVLSNVTIGAEGNDSLFGKIDGGKIDGLGIAGIDVTVTGSNGGMLASSATNGAAITNSYVVGTLSTSASDDQSNIGGLVGETDNATIDGCIVSGKIVSDSSRTGGVIGSALDGSVIRNVLSTAYVDGGAGVTGGIVGTAEDSAEITSCIFASDVKSTNAQTEGNIIGDGSAGDENCYYDKQMSSVIDSANGVSTHYLTGGATMEQLGFGESMVRIEGFAGYPVPAAFVNEEVSDQFLAGVKLASAKINLASGAGAGTVNSFTNITAPSDLGTYSAQLEFGGGTPAYLVSVADTQIDTDTSTLALGDVVNRYVTYTLADGSFDGAKMLRYLDLYVGKTMKVTYKFVDLESDANAVLTVFSGMSNVSSVTAFAVAGKHSGELCSSMVIPYDSDEGAYILRVGSELPSGKAIKAVSADVLESGSSVLDSKLSGEELDNGSWKIKLETNGSIDCDEIEITVTVDDDSAWGIHKYFNLF